MNIIQGKYTVKLAGYFVDVAIIIAIAFYIDGITSRRMRRRAVPSVRAAKKRSESMTPLGSD